MTDLNDISKSRDIILLTKVHLVKPMVFPVVMYGCESWTIKKAECRRTDAFELWCWRGLLRVSWTARRSNQSIIKEINPEYSLQGLMLKPQYFGSLMLGKIEGKRRIGRQRMPWVGSITDSMDMNLGKLWEVLKDRESGMLQSLGLQSTGHDLATEQQQKIIDNVRVGVGDLEP